MGDPDCEPDFDEGEEEFAEAEANCGLMVMADGKTEMCMSAGTEWCDFVCPFRDEASQFRTRKRKPDPAPLLKIMQAIDKTEGR